MFELAVERDFRAAHAITIGGVPETTHEHCWRVTVAVTGEGLDDDGLLCDFHVLEERLDAALAGLRDRDLNRTPPFDQINPTAENVARHIAGELDLPEGVTLARVSVTEAPGCTATYRPSAVSRRPSGSDQRSAISDQEEEARTERPEGA